MYNNTFKSVICLAAFMWLAGAAHTYAQQQDDVDRYIRRAQAADEKGNFNNALNEYKNALKLAPNYPELYKAIGVVYEKLGTTADLDSAIVYYQRYIQLAPQANDAQQIKQRTYALEYLWEESTKQDSIFKDLSGEWVAIENIAISKIESDGKIWFISNFVFQIAEIQKTGKYRITMKPEGNRNYSTNLIEKTVNIVPAKDNSFTFTFADATVHTPKSGGYNLVKFLGHAYGQTTGNTWVSDLTNIAADAVQESDLPSNTQTAYTFALKYDEGKLVGLVNVVGKFSDPTRQQTTGNEMYEITFVKNDGQFRKTLNTVMENNPDVINAVTHKDKWGKKLSDNEISDKLYTFDPKLGKSYYNAKNTATGAQIMSWVSLATMVSGAALWGFAEDNLQQATTGQIMLFGSMAIEIVSIAVGTSAIKTKNRLINQYNEQIMQQHKNKPMSELRFGVTSSGGLGLTLNF